MPFPLVRMSLLLTASGFCALVYQSAWARLFRLLFGATTAATGATLALFMGGLGLGGWLLGRRIERHANPLALYARLELGVAGLAVLSLGLMPLATAAYHASGGSQALGLVGATALRLVLAALVMGPASVMMGATLPAAARVVTTDDDTGRTRVGLLVGVNTLGAVVGTGLTTFLLLETLGTRGTLLVAAALNVVVGLVALGWSQGGMVGSRHPDRSAGHSADRSADRSREVPPGRRDLTPAPSGRDPSHPADVPRRGPPWDARGAERRETESGRPAPLGVVLGAAGVVGFAFMLLELVWYRLLAPILGGSTYTFGVVLAVALSGLALGGAAYAAWGRRLPATMTALAATCAAEALLVAVPFAMGDRIALLAAYLRPLSALGFGWLFASWVAVSLVVVLPAALAAGFQFPLLVALAGRGRAEVGREVGLVYAANTLGSIVGSLAGGFGLLPLLGAVGAWRLTATLLALVAAAAALHGLSTRRTLTGGLALVMTLCVWPCLQAEGPTAAWRHSAIGAGRASVASLRTTNQVLDWRRTMRRNVSWEADGVESSVAIQDGNGVSVIVNGKSDGNTTSDAGTTLMLGLLGPLTTDAPKTALVVGLGTGMTAGWLGRVPSIERVDVAELEPAVVRVAQAAHEANEAVLQNPKVHLRFEDARELLLTARERYDLVVSEPSNPYRAGVASLFTAEFFAAAKAHLSDDGMLLQWLQAYEVDTVTLQSVLATVGSVFPYVDVWQTTGGDLLLRGLKRPPARSADALRRKLAQPPFAAGVRTAWTTDSLEGVLAHFVADDALVRRLLARPDRLLNTDDLNVVEFGFARSVGAPDAGALTSLRQMALEAGADRPSWLAGDVDWSSVARERVPLGLPDRTGALDATALARARRLVPGQPSGELVAAWRGDPFAPVTLRERLVLARALAEAGDDACLPLMAPLEALMPAETALVAAQLLAVRGQPDEAAQALMRAIDGWRRQRWLAPEVGFAGAAMAVVQALGEPQRASTAQLFAALGSPFPAAAEETVRRELRLQLSIRLASTEACTAAFGLFEPHTPWLGAFLSQRRDCYEAAHDARAALAREELRDFRRAEGLSGPDGDAVP